MLGEARPSARRTTRTAPRAPGVQPWVIPFDYAARFKLTGRPGNVVESVINISPDGVFVATAIGYGLDEDRGREIHVLDATSGAPIADQAQFVPANTKLGQIPAEALIQGFRIAPKFESLVFPSDGGDLNSENIGGTFAARILERMKTPKEISFLFSIVDTSSGRELQDQPAHNLSSLGISNGERPFRTLAYPLSFAPRSTLRLQIIERSVDTWGFLYIVLFGYRIVTGTQCPEVLTRAIGAAASMAPSMPASSDMIPFDYVATVPLSGRPNTLVETEVPINAEGAFLATAIAYGLEPADDRLNLVWENAGPSITPDELDLWDGSKLINLADVFLRVFPRETLRDGIRIRPSYVRFAFRSASTGVRLGQVPKAMLPELFESLNRAEAVSFRYEIFDGGSGRDLQNEAVHNIAGLGIANGERPFKRFARPMVFLPRSTVRIRIQERFGRGNLQLAFHGYKLLGITRARP